MEPMPTLVKTFSLIFQQECEFKATFHSNSQDSIANLTFHEGHGKNFRGDFFGTCGRARFPRSGGRNPKYCNYCHNCCSSMYYQTHKFCFSFSFWIIDTGATDHICHFKSLFQNFKPISLISIQLHNQNSVIAKFSGTIVMENIILHNILFVLQFSVQLICIPKLLNSTNCFMVFSQNTCFTVQTNTFQPIGATRKR